MLDTESIGQPTKAGPENRRAPRHKAVLLVCRLVAQNSDDICLINDISEFGAKAQTAQKLKVGDRVAFEFGNQYALSGTVRWVRDKHVGVEFDIAAELAPVFSKKGRSAIAERDAAEATDTRRLFPRIRRCAHVRLYLQGREHTAELFDLSPTGAGIDIRHDEGLRIGDWVQCEIEGVADRTATVRWIAKDRLGLSFDKPLPLRPLDEWLIAATDQCDGCTVKSCTAPSSKSHNTNSKSIV